MNPIRVQADFNGLFGDVLCLTHTETCKDGAGAEVRLEAGMVVTAFDEDADDNGNRDDLVATGTVVPSPDWLTCRGSRWALNINQDGVRHESEIRNA
ncbi:hypothetical protein [Luteolibacter soli]|uniref:Uncharacterized protein n=1 Tax=Luteolibacter soli TaxID=3135280 RepID=A0ABU9B159_9BACT